MDASAILAILVLLVALVVPVFLLMRTQNAAKGKEVCMHGCTVYAQYILSVFRKSVSCVSSIGSSSSPHLCAPACVIPRACAFVRACACVP